MGTAQCSFWLKSKPTTQPDQPFTSFGTTRPITGAVPSNNGSLDRSAAYISSNFPHIVHTCNPIERLWAVMHAYVTLHAYITHNRFYPTQKHFAEAIPRFFRETIPKPSRNFRDWGTNNFRIISYQNFRVLQ